MTSKTVQSKRRIRLKSTLRVKRDWYPDWWSSIYGWTINYLLKNKWRCDPVLDMEDLMQDAYIVFDKVVAAYPRVTEPKHFMALFKTALRNAIFDKARNERLRLNYYGERIENVENLKEVLIGELTNEGELLASINSGPIELRMLLEAFNDESKVEKLRSMTRTKKGQMRYGLNEQFSRMIDLDKRVDFVKMFKEVIDH